MERHVAALIRSRLVHVLESGESLQECLEFVGVEGCTAEDSLRIDVLLRGSHAELTGVDGVAEAELGGSAGTAEGWALKKRCERCRPSSILTTTTAAPATYAKERVRGKLSNPVGELTVVPMILFKDRPDSW